MSVAQRAEHRHLPVTVEQPNAALAEAADDVARFMETFAARFSAKMQEANVCALVGPNDERVPLPKALYDALLATAEILAAGGSVTIVPVEKELTTQEAADMLNMSRQFLVRLLNENAIPHHRVNTHRRIKLGDLLAFKAKRDSSRRDALKRLTRITEEAGTPDVFPDQERE